MDSIPFKMEFAPGSEVDCDLECSYVDEMLNVAAETTPTSWLMTSNSTVTSAIADDYDPNGGYYLGYLDTSTSPPQIDSETSESSTSVNATFGRAAAGSSSTGDGSPPAFIPPNPVFSGLDDLEDVFKLESDTDLAPLISTDIYQLAYDEGVPEVHPEVGAPKGKGSRKYQKRSAKKIEVERAEVRTAATGKRRRPKRVSVLDGVSDETNSENEAKISNAAEGRRAPKKIRAKSKPKFVPDEEKDAAYWAHRSKNTQAAKRSRAKKKCLESNQDSFEEIMEARNLDEKAKVQMRRIRSEFGDLIFKAFWAGKGEVGEKEENEDEEDEEAKG